jgi:cyclase
MKKRLIPSILLRCGTSVSLSQQFKPWRTVGALAQQLRLHVRRHCDEILIVNTDLAGSGTFHCPQRLLSLVRQEVDVPIAYAGGIASETDAAQCINAGFDKVYMTSLFLDDPSGVQRVASLIGSQSVGVCLPYRRESLESDALIWDYRTLCLRHDQSLTDALASAVAHGAGEILLHDVDRDGSLRGLDLSILPKLEACNISVPVLIAGGAGSSSHISSALASPVVQGVVASSIFSLTQETPGTIRAHCEELGIPMRRP